MRHVIVGTAGHIDHGKTALVRALTGIDTDRLEEEKRRGISIDLGFAHLNLADDLRIALVDVPGHERFIKNMLAGVGGIDIVMLVIAADESIKPQTREHLDICRLLRIPSGVIAITKADLVDAEILQLVQMEVQDFVSGTFLAEAPLIPVSVVTGAGLAELREALQGAAAAVRVRSADRIFRLPVDRAFSMTGFGTVVTGTLFSGTISIEDEVQAYPGSATFRVRGIEVHGRREERAYAGQRAALNLSGDNPEQLMRGVVLSEPGRFLSTRLVDCSLELLDSAPPIKSGTPVHFHAGTSEIGAEIRILEPKMAIEPGETHLVRLALDEPALLLPGDRFIIRRFSPVVTIGGGYAIDANPPRSNRVVAFSRARSLDRASLSERGQILVDESPVGIAMSELVARTGEKESCLIAVLAPQALTFGDPPSWLLGRGRAHKVIEGVAGRLREFHRVSPLAPGISKEELRTRHLPGAPAPVFAALLKSASEIVIDGELIHLATHKLTFKEDEEEALARIEHAFEQARLAVPGVAEVLQKSGVEGSRAKSLLQILLRSKRLVRVGEDFVFHPSVLDELRGQLRARKGQAFSVGDFKQWTGVSRKYAIPLLEFLDREKITRRQGESRVVL
jgi:selenocysteine-specific elongation factor